jgi:hypothetical protein
MFSKTFESKRYDQIVLMKRQDTQGAPEIRFYFTAEGYGVCEFSIGFQEDCDAETRLAQAFDQITPQEATKIIDGWMDHMQSSKERH